MLRNEKEAFIIIHITYVVRSIRNRHCNRCRHYIVHRVFHICSIQLNNLKKRKIKIRSRSRSYPRLDNVLILWLESVQHVRRIPNRTKLKCKMSFGHLWKLSKIAIIDKSIRTMIDDGFFFFTLKKIKS